MQQPQDLPVGRVSDGRTNRVKQPQMCCLLVMPSREDAHALPGHTAGLVPRQRVRKC